MQCVTFIQYSKCVINVGCTKICCSYYIHNSYSTICSLGRCSAVLHTSCVPPPEVPRGCGLKGRGQGWTGPKRAKVAQVDLVKSRGNWRQVYSGGQGAWGEDGEMV